MTLKQKKQWKPTPAQRRAKALLHKYCGESALRSLTPGDSELPRYLAPTPMPLVRKWLSEQKEFWPWLLTPLECDEKIYHAKDLAYAFLVEVLEMKTKTKDGGIDGEVLKAKMKAAEFLLAKNAPAVQVNNNTLNAPNTLPPGGVPRGLKGKDGRLIDRQIAALEAATDVGIVDATPADEEI